MTQLLQPVHKGERVHLRVTTHDPTNPEAGTTVYDIDEPDSSGWRSIKRGDDRPLRGRLQGSITVKAQDAGAAEKMADESADNTFLIFGSTRCTITDESVSIGQRMYIEVQGEQTDFIISRPIHTIELID